MLSPNEMETIFDSLPVALLTTDKNRVIVAANPAALELFGYEAEELLGQPVEVLIPERLAQVHPVHYQHFVDTPSNRKMGQGRDLAAKRKDGTEFPVEIGLTVLEVEPRRFLCSIIDISLRKQTEVLLRERQDMLESALEEARATLENEISDKARLEERQRLGRELHDSLSQNLYGIGLGLRTALAKQKKGLDLSDPLNYCLTLTESSLIEMRALLFRLRPKSLENVPLGDVLSSHAQAVTARTKVPIVFEELGTAKAELPFEQKYTLYRIVTEALHNSLKHSKASAVKVILVYDVAGVRVEVSDNGLGFDPEANPLGHGLNTMQERADAVQGTLAIKSCPEGTTVCAEVPWTQT